jgi:hypothetical protein
MHFFLEKDSSYSHLEFIKTQSFSKQVSSLQHPRSYKDNFKIFHSNFGVNTIVEFSLNIKQGYFFKIDTIAELK